ncbi:DNA repair protein endonuclease SAE2/CtIP C-terminus-domain-containing protein [Ephemerocybe angulata]|uniref:DNA repair protein endonuclease SAE2/CtIP C-terminus-domain-containing protein n=1 Tax=Ephemerocybe angulata TaxID=980116 RepID=A0A8H6LT38_9AGAR|nr:DNA repair protein endonuclease SAE2/CtIP C-terminus-domain-containing protein [Tulosesus angulatus]
MHGETFSSAQSRERDKRIEEKHRKELQVLEARINNLRRSNDDIRKELFDVTHRARRLAECLGFPEVRDAQEALDMMLPDFDFKNCVQRLQDLEAAAEDSKAAAKTYYHQLEEVRGQLQDSLNEIDEQSNNYALLARDNDQIRTQYAALELKFTRAANRYKEDYAKWRSVSAFLTTEDKKYRGQRSNRVATTPAEQKLMMDRLGPNLGHFDGVDDPPPEGNTDLPDHLATPELRQSDMEHLISSASTSKTLADSIFVPRPLTKLRRQHALPSSSPTVFTATPTTKQVDIDLTVSSDTEEEPKFSPSHPPPFKLPGIPLSKLKSSVEAPSSDTEPESHPLTPPRASQNKLALEFASSDTEPETHPLTPPPPDAKPFDLSQEQPSPGDTTPVRRQPSDVLTTANTNTRRPGDRQVASERPVKVRRVNGGEFGGGGESSSVTPRPKAYDENSQPSSQEVAKKKAPQSEPKKSANDYSVFKGKGRYARKSDVGPSTSINSKFVIDPKRNGGKDYQFDEVVRGRDQRKQMNATTCECCDEYYKAVGPLPSRLKAPLWRSPSKTAKKKCQHHRGDEDHSSPSASSSRDIESHKKNISRHRYNWERAKTPPDYWNIGFPSTQEVGAINERAQAMHREKVRGIEKEAAAGTGKYRRRS